MMVCCEIGTELSGFMKSGDLKTDEKLSVF